MKYKTVMLLLIFALTKYLALAQVLSVDPNTNIKVLSGTTLKISGGDLLLKSDANGDASLIDLGNVTYTGGGESKVERYLTNGKWHLISAPVAETFAAQFQNDFLQFHDEETNNWFDITSVGDELLPGKGYSLWTIDGAPTTEVFSGITHTGDQSFSFSQTGQGFNLIGNPYPSTLDWDAVTIPSELNGAIWLFDPTVGDNGIYKYYIFGGGGANTTTQYISSGQGFFVRATGGAGTLTLQNDDRVHGGQAFYKSGYSNEMLVLKATGNNITTQTAIRFNPDATPQVDRLYDVNKILSNSSDVPVVYTKCENQLMAINTLPAIAGNETVPVYFQAGLNGTYSFSATEMESLGDEVPVFLEDISMNYMQDLRANPDYSFAYTTGATKEFMVHFKDVTGIELPEDTGKLAVNCFLMNHILHVNFKDANSENGRVDATISVHGITGQQILVKESSQLVNEIPFAGSQSIYIVTIITNEGIYSTKVYNRK